MEKKQNLVKRTASAVVLGTAFMAFAFGAEWKDEKPIPKESEVMAQKVFDRIIEVSRHPDSEVVLQKQNYEFKEYSFVDKSISRQVSCLVPSENTGLKPVIEILNLKTGEIFFDSGLNGFYGDLADDQYSPTRDFEDNDILAVAYRAELDFIWASLAPKKLNVQ